MFRLCQDTYLPEFIIKFFHKCGNLRFDNAKIMIIHFLSLRRLCAKQGSTCKAKIRTFFVHFPSNKEVFLLRTDRAGNSLYTVIAEQSEYTNSLLVKCFHRTKQRSFLVKSMSII